MDVAFVWNLDCQQSFDALKRALVDAPIFVCPDFKKPFCLDVNWSTKGVGAILSQKEGKLEKVMAFFQQEFNYGTKEIPTHGRKVLCIDMGHHAFQAISAHEPFHSKNRSQVA